MQMVEQRRINPPESPEHYRQMLRQMYKGLKRVFGSMPHDVKGRYAMPYRKSRIVLLDVKQKSRDSMTSGSS